MSLSEYHALYKSLSGKGFFGDFLVDWFDDVDGNDSGNGKR